MNSDKLEKLTGVCAPVPSDAPSIRDEKSNTSQSQISTAIAINNKVPKNNSKIIPQTFVIQRRPNLFALDIFFWLPKPLHSANYSVVLILCHLVSSRRTLWSPARRVAEKSLKRVKGRTAPLVLF
jgi:hypothetical protein